MRVDERRKGQSLSRNKNEYSEEEGEQRTAYLQFVTPDLSDD